MARGLLCAAMCSAMVCFAQVTAAQPDTPPAADKNGVFVDLQVPAERRSAAVDALVRKASERGQVRVIVGLRTVLRSEEELSEAEAARQTERLHAIQTTVATRAGVAASDTITFDYVPFVSLWVDAAQLQRLLRDPDVVNIQEDVPGTVGLQRSVPYIKAPALWRKGAKGRGWTIAILDTGVDRKHPMFSGGKVVSEACYSTNNPQQNIRSFCPNRATESTRRGSGKPCPAKVDTCWHGTHVAGIAAGIRGNRKGVARAAKIIAIQVFSKQGNGTVTFDTDWIRGLERVYRLRNKFKIAAANMSLGFGNFSSICDDQNPAATAIIRKLRNARIATVVAAMNDSKNGSTRSPACISEAITVGATGRASDDIAGFSNQAPWVRHMAPGVAINSASLGGKYRKSDGTSMAAPHAAGAYALLRDVHRGATVDDIAAALECTGVPVTRAGITEHRINLAKAYRYLLKPPRKKQRSNFDNGAPGWSWHLANHWSVGSSQLFVSDASPGYKAVTTSHCNESMNIEARVGRVWGAQGGISGILFKAQFAGSRVSGYFAGYNKNGAFVVLRFDHYDLATDSGPFAQLCSTNVNLSGNFNRIKLVSRGGRHKLFFNGSNTPVCNVNDRSYGTGRAGALAFFAGAGNQFGVDYFNIFPKEKVPRVGSSNGALEMGEDDEGTETGKGDEFVSASNYAPVLIRQAEPAADGGTGAGASKARAVPPPGG